ncbi:zinc ABC transporter substrate-binding protein [Bacillus sp. IB182487]|uniref:Zinc ABC transporter substrate-binding protein n=2 Tax=Metabacillus arenae TaxID=2771434 RepID=A0A926NFE6_9BACI|nr:zinc ABC transporter substrate-binding protein [Metabacillus arenae]
MFISILLVAAMSACGKQTTGENGKIKVTTTIAQIADAVQNIGGEHVEVTSLMGPGVDPHLYQASQGDMKKLSDADIIFYNGLHLEGKMGEIFEKIEKQKPTIPVADAIPKDVLLNDAANSSAHDPHVWFSIPNWLNAVDAVEKELAELNPDLKEEFAANADEYKTKLQEMDNYAKEQIDSIPEKSRVLVTAHDAFAYFGKEYGFEVMGLQGLSTDSEYGLKDVQDLVDVLVERDIKAVFVESSISEKSINAVVQGAKEKGHEVEIGGELYSDAMGEEGTEEGTYLGMFKHNIDTIVSSLK